MPFLNKKDEAKKNRVASEFKEKFPDLFSAVYNEGFEDGQATVDFQIDPLTINNLSFLESGSTKPKTVDRKLTVEEQAKIIWDKDPQIRKEFDGDYESYLAYEKAYAKGQVKILGA